MPLNYCGTSLENESSWVASGSFSYSHIYNPVQEHSRSPWLRDQLPVRLGAECMAYLGSVERRSAWPLPWVFPLGVGLHLHICCQMTVTSLGLFPEL